MDTLSIDFNKKIKDIKPINGVTNGPGLHKGALDASCFFTELGFPLSRLHDTNLLSTKHVIDYYYIFRDFTRDENDPQNYDFARTDAYLEKLQTLGADIIYRLGPSAPVFKENRYAVFPCSVEKLSTIMLHIVDHYCGKWANGYAYTNLSFEIWNEPDLTIFYRGDEEEFYRFYDLTANKIKAKYPALKVGGCAFCRVDTEFGIHFLDYVQKHHSPMDYLSYHFYNTDAANLHERSETVRRLMDERGLQNVPTVLDEWNFNINFHDRLNESYPHISKITGACFSAAMLAKLERERIDYATYYDMQTNYMMFVYNGLYGFNGFKLFKKKPYYSFLYFKWLKELKTETYIDEFEDVFTVAASDGTIGRAMITNYSFEKPSEKEFALKVNEEYKTMTVFRTGKKKTNEMVYSGEILPKLTLEQNAVYYLEFRKQEHPVSEKDFE